MAFRWRAEDSPLIVVFGSSLPSSTKKTSKFRTYIGSVVIYQCMPTFWFDICFGRWLTDRKRLHLNEVDYPPYRTTNYRVSCTWASKLRSEIVWHRFPAFIRRLMSYIAVRKLFLKTSPNFSSRFRGSACFWQSPDILKKSENSEMRTQTKSSCHLKYINIHRYVSSLESIMQHTLYLDIKCFDYKLE